MRIKAKRISKSMLSAVLTVLMLLSCVTVGVIPTDAAMEVGSVGDATWSFSGTSYIYFDNTVTNWNDNCICLIIGRDTNPNNQSDPKYSKVYQMSKVANTTLLVCQLPGSDWTDAEYMAVIGTSTKWGDGNWGSDNLTNATHYTAAYSSGLSASNDQLYRFTPASADNGMSIALNYFGDNISNMNNTQTVSCQISENNGATYSAASTAPAKLTVSGKKFTAYNSCATDSEGTVTKGSSTVSATASIGYRALATFKVENVAPDYTFVGWYNGSGTQLSTDTTYNTLRPTGANTITAYFKHIISYSSLSYAVNVNGAASTNLTAAITNTTATNTAGTTVTATNGDSSYYTFTGWTSANGTFANANALSTTFYPLSNNAVATANFEEKSFTVTVSGGTHGSASPSTITAHPYTPVNLSSITLTPDAGYHFNGWESAATVTLSGNSSSDPAVGTLTATATGTLTATYDATERTINASLFSSNYSDGNQIVVSPAAGVIGDTYTITVTLDTGYEVDEITGTGLTTPTLSKNGNVWTYTYTIGTSNVSAVVKLKAKTPEFTAAYVQDTTNFDTDSYTNIISSSAVNHYYGQPDVVYAVTDLGSFNKLNLTYSNVSYSESRLASADNQVVSLTQKPVTLSGANSTASYQCTITAVNSPDGVASSASATFTYTVTVSYNAAQKKKLALNTKLEKYFMLDGRYGHNYDNYYQDLPNAAETDYNNKYDAAKNFTAHYNTADSEVDTLETEFDAAVAEIYKYAKKTTVYVMVKTAKASNLKFHVWQNSNDDDWAHFRMLTSYDEGTYAHDSGNDVDYCKCTPVLKGSFKKTSDNDCKLYSFTYTGNAKFIVYSGASLSNDTKLTGNITVTTAFKDYYIDCYEGNTTDKTLRVADENNTNDEYVDFGINVTSDNKRWVDAEVPQTKADLKRLLEIECVGSTVTSPGTKYTDVEFKIEGPGGTCYLNNETDTFPASTHGKYTLTYSVKFDSTANSTAYIREISKTFWVAYEEIKFYADMNDNVGNPILKFKYYLNESGNPTATKVVTEGGEQVIKAIDDSGTVTGDATATYLPCEMELVSGSESIYKYAVNLKKLRENYKVTLSAEKPINISSITVENVDYNNDGDGYDILDDARLNGEAWFKADSTHMKGFDIISYGSVNRKFLAVNEESKAVLAGGVNKISGTGIVSDFNDVYNVQYAGLFFADGAAAPMNNFHYTLGVRMNEEFSITTGSGQSATVTKYYFDKWVKLSDCDEVPVTSDGVNLTGAETFDGSDKADLNFTKAPDYREGSEAYIALYKAVTTGDSTVRLEITYNFEDYNTTDGNYVFDPNKGTVNASYTKTVKVPVGEGQTYANFAAVNNDEAVNALANVNAPFISSNYYDYEYDTNPDADHALTFTEVEQESKIKVNAHIRKTERPYQITVSYGSTNKSHTGRFQQTVTLKASEFTDNVNDDASNNFHWTDNDGNVIAVGGTFNARYFYNDDSGNPELIKLVAGPGSVANSSVIVASYTERYDEGTTNMLRHNFMIIDHCGKGKLVGGGVLFATGSYSNASDPATWSYRRQSAETNLADSNARETFIRGILNSDYETEYPVQTISNIGFRYAPDNEEIFRWSDNLQAYLTQFEGTNVNSPNYTGQKLRMFSFMVYNNGTDENPDYVVESSEGFAEVSRYLPQG